jgi:hypothetical protein
MALQPHQLSQLLDDVNDVYSGYFLPVCGGDTGVQLWICADSGGTSLPAAEAARLKGYADAHLTAHRQDGRARDIFIRLAQMGNVSSATVDTGSSV